MPHPILIPIGFRLLIAAAAAIAGALVFGLAKAANKSNDALDEAEKEKEEKKQ